METVTFTPTPDQYAFTFGGADPVMRVDPGTALQLWCQDAYCGRIASTGDKASVCLVPTELNPQTGPFYVNGAQPGDTLAIHIVDLTPAHTQGASALIPYFGGLTSTPQSPTLQPALDERTYIYEYDAASDTVRYQAQHSDLTLDLPANPMLGTVGVAPAAREVRTSLVPEMFGGNMDTPELRAGATCFLTVNVEGALFSLGDGHYRQGEGESCGTAVEGAMNVTIIVDLIKGGDLGWPRLESDDALCSIGSARPLENAWRISQVDMVGWLGTLYELDPIDAYQLIAQIGQVPVANVVDTNFSVVTKIDKSLLPQTTTYDGMHQRLREASKTLGTITY